jgi:hypothetical protein
MKLELVLILVVCFILYDTYYGKGYLKYLYSLKKHAKTITLLIGILGVYLMLKKDPSNFKKALLNANQLVTTLPMQSTPFATSSILGLGLPNPYANEFQDVSNSPGTSSAASSLKRLISSGKGATKRSVSETKKKYVAASQDWKCGGCGEKLNAWFEVDHKVRLEYGGGNEVTNLVALCRECHGEKTAMENM